MAQSKTLVIFYSREGATALLAKTMADAIGADVAELRLKKSLPSGFFKFVIGGMQVMFNMKPALLPLDKNLSEYDRILVGTPIWAGNRVPALRTFSATAKLAGKKVAFFCCCADNPGKALDTLKQEFAGNTFIGEMIFRSVWKNKEESVARAKTWAQEMFKT